MAEEMEGNGKNLAVAQRDISDLEKHMHSLETTVQARFDRLEQAVWGMKADVIEKLADFTPNCQVHENRLRGLEAWRDRATGLYVAATLSVFGALVALAVRVLSP